MDDNTYHKGMQWKVWTGFVWRRTGTSSALLRTR